MGEAESWPGRATQSFYHHWVGSKVSGGSDRPLPASHFFFSLSAAPLAFSRGRISTTPLLAGRAWAWLRHTPSGRGGPALGFLPPLGRLIGGKQPSSLLQNRKPLSLLPEGQELSPWQPWDRGARSALLRSGPAEAPSSQPLVGVVLRGSHPPSLTTTRGGRGGRGPDFIPIAWMATWRLTTPRASHVQQGTRRGQRSTGWLR